MTPNPENRREEPTPVTAGVNPPTSELAASGAEFNQPRNTFDIHFPLSPEMMAKISTRPSDMHRAIALAVSRMLPCWLPKHTQLVTVGDSLELVANLNAAPGHELALQEILAREGTIAQEFQRILAAGDSGGGVTPPSSSRSASGSGRTGPTEGGGTGGADIVGPGSGISAPGSGPENRWPDNLEITFQIVGAKTIFGRTPSGEMRLLFYQDDINIKNKWYNRIKEIFTGAMLVGPATENFAPWLAPENDTKYQSFTFTWRPDGPNARLPAVLDELIKIRNANPAYSELSQLISTLRSLGIQPSTSAESLIRYTDEELEDLTVENLYDAIRYRDGLDDTGRIANQAQVEKIRELLDQFLNSSDAAVQSKASSQLAPLFRKVREDPTELLKLDLGDPVKNEIAIGLEMDDFSLASAVPRRFRPGTVLPTSAAMVTAATLAPWAIAAAAGVAGNPMVQPMIWAASFLGAGLMAERALGWVSDMYKKTWLVALNVAQDRKDIFFQIGAARRVIQECLRHKLVWKRGGQNPLEEPDPTMEALVTDIRRNLNGTSSPPRQMPERFLSTAEFQLATRIAGHDRVFQEKLDQYSEGVRQTELKLAVLGKTGEVFDLKNAGIAGFVGGRVVETPLDIIRDARFKSVKPEPRSDAHYVETVWDRVRTRERISMLERRHHERERSLTSNPADQDLRSAAKRSAEELDQARKALELIQRDLAAQREVIASTWEERNGTGKKSDGIYTYYFLSGQQRLEGKFANLAYAFSFGRWSGKERDVSIAARVENLVALERKATRELLNFPKTPAADQESYKISLGQALTDFSEKSDLPDLLARASYPVYHLIKTVGVPGSLMWLGYGMVHWLGWL